MDKKTYTKMIDLNDHDLESCINKLNSQHSRMIVHSMKVDTNAIDKCLEEINSLKDEYIQLQMAREVIMKSYIDYLENNNG